MTFEEWWEANGPKGSAYLVPSTYKSWCRWAFEAGQSNDQEPEYLTADQLTEPGYYWWLPECFIDQPEVSIHWDVEYWDPNDPTHPYSGLFSGPIKAPVKRKE